MPAAALGCCTGAPPCSVVRRSLCHYSVDTNAFSWCRAQSPSPSRGAEYSSFIWAIEKKKKACRGVAVLWLERGRDDVAAPSLGVQRAHLARRPVPVQHRADEDLARTCTWPGARVQTKIAGCIKILRSPPHVLIRDGASCGDAGGSVHLCPATRTGRHVATLAKSKQVSRCNILRNGCGGTQCRTCAGLAAAALAAQPEHKLAVVPLVLHRQRPGLRVELCHGKRARTPQDRVESVYGTEVVGSSGARACTAPGLAPEERTGTQPADARVLPLPEPLTNEHARHQGWL